MYTVARKWSVGRLAGPPALISRLTNSDCASATRASCGSRPVRRGLQVDFCTVSQVLSVAQTADFVDSQVRTMSSIADWRAVLPRC